VKDLARMNNIPAPYTIEVGQKLKVNGGSSSTAKNPRRLKRKPPK
jgi:lipoprotein YgeR